jgi:hypothetical protein
LIERDNKNSLRKRCKSNRNWLRPPMFQKRTATAASRTLEPNQVLILLAARPTGAQWLCPPL